MLILRHIFLFVLFLFATQKELLSLQVDNFNINISSFSSTQFTEKDISEEDYTDFIKDHIFSQPEYTYAIASENEKNYLLTSAVRSRFPSISGSVINDEVLDRNIDDFNSIRKRQDDSFDAVAEINQPIYTGGRISSTSPVCFFEVR